MRDRSTAQSVDRTGRHRIEAEPTHATESGLHVRPRNPRWLWLILVIAVVTGALLGILPFAWGPGGPSHSDVPAPAPLPETPRAIPEQSSTPEQTPSTAATTSARPRSSRAAPTEAGTQSTPAPVLLGPGGRSELEDMVQQYCERHARGLADPGGDGGWQCRRLLSASEVDMDVACRESYGPDAFARLADADDAYSWRCYR